MWKEWFAVIIALSSSENTFQHMSAHCFCIMAPFTVRTALLFWFILTNFNIIHQQKNKNAQYTMWQRN